MKKSNSNQKGGKRVGSGRKPSGDSKEMIGIYISKNTIAHLGKEKLRNDIYGYVELLEQMIPKVGTLENGLPVIRDATPEEAKRTTTLVLKPKEEPNPVLPANSSNDDNEAILKQIEAVRAEKCPKERDTVFGRKSFEMDKQKRINELKNKLNNG